MPDRAAPRPSTRAPARAALGRVAPELLLTALAAAGVYVAYVNAWVVDDAYITFRSIENLVGGRGLTWNPGERVQVFTHPLWMLVMTAARLVTGEYFYTVLAVSFALSAAALAILAAALVRRRGPLHAAFFVALALSTKAVVDFASSGLENPLSYLLAAVFFTTVLGAEEDARPLGARASFGLLAVAALAFVNRHDTALLYVPAGALLFARAPAPSGARRGLYLLAAASPALLWLGFALLYFGFPLPNTYYAKVTTGVPLGDRLARGLGYLANSLAWDAPAHLAVASAAALALARRQRMATLALAGVALYDGYAVVQACTTHMAGRFFAVPLFTGALVLAHVVPRGAARALAGGLAALALWNAASPIAPIKMDSGLYRSPAASVHSPIDTSRAVHAEGAALVDWRRGEPLPDHAGIHEGERFRAMADRVHVGGHMEAVGYFAFAAGPDKTIVDVLALAEPLLARLPACNAGTPRTWASGHFYRLPPDGFVESLKQPGAEIADPSLREYDARLRLVTRGPLWSGRRLVEIARMNLGLEDHLVREYLARNPVPPGDCRRAIWGRYEPPGERAPGSVANAWLFP
jgi:arabinofuranosyltransferase